MFSHHRKLLRLLLVFSNGAATSPLLRRWVPALYHFQLLSPAGATRHGSLPQAVSGNGQPATAWRRGRRCRRAGPCFDPYNNRGYRSTALLLASCQGKSPSTVAAAETGSSLRISLEFGGTALPGSDIQPGTRHGNSRPPTQRWRVRSRVPAGDQVPELFRNRYRHLRHSGFHTLEMKSEGIADQVVAWCGKP